MKKPIKTIIVLKNGDKIEIVQPGDTPLDETIVFRLVHCDKTFILSRDFGDLYIPIENILFVSTIDFEIEEDF